MNARNLAAIVYPWVHPVHQGAAARRSRWLLHLAFWCVLLVGLWQLNSWSGVDRLLRSPWPALHRLWLPLLAASLYPLGWLGLGLWTALRREPSAAAWPEVESAWTEARHALAQAGIDVRSTPTFLLLGAAAPELHAALEALGGRALPHRAGAPFQIVAHARAVYLAVVAGAALRQTLLHDLCSVLMRERSPRHPLQGIVVTAPFDAGKSRDLTNACRDELHAIRQATGLELPIFFVVSGLDADPHDGDPWFERFPPLPDLDPAEIATMYQLGMDWLCLERIPQQLRAKIRLTPAALPENIRLYQRQSALADKRTPLAKMLGEAARTEDAELGMVAGCYVLPPAEKAGELAAILQADLLAHQHSACWTAATVAEDAVQRRRVKRGYLLASLAALSSAAVAAAWFWIRDFSHG